MTKFEIVTVDEFDAELDLHLLSQIVETVKKETTLVSAKAINTSRVKDCSKDVCSFDE